MSATSKHAYPCVGGPLDGEHATTDDMRPTLIALRDIYYTGLGDPKKRGKLAYREGDVVREGGLYGRVADEYVEYNQASGRGSKRIGGFPPTMIYVHKSLLKPLISARDR